MTVRFKVFESGFKSWEAIFEEAAAFASSIHPERLISISHSHGWSVLKGQSMGVVTVWYWEEEQHVPSKLA